MNRKNTLIIVLIALAITLLLHPAASYAKSKDANAPLAKSNNSGVKNSKKEITPKKITPEQETTINTAVKAAAAASSASEGAVGESVVLSPLLTESFKTDLSTGAATASIPIVVPPGRRNMQPNFTLSYSSNNPNGICGIGWSLTSSNIRRSTKKGLPEYDSSDTFVFASSGSSEDLVEISPNEYRQKIETAFMKYVYDDVGLKWDVWDKNGTKYTFGSSIDSRIVDDTASKIFAWFLDKAEDLYGNYITYIYEKNASGQIYLKEINYTGGAGLTPDKSIVFNYITNRTDKAYNYRTGWEIVTDWLLSSIDITFEGNPEWHYELSYISSPNTQRFLLSQIKLVDKNGNSLPPKKFKYQSIE